MRVMRHAHYRPENMVAKIYNILRYVIAYV